MVIKKVKISGFKGITKLELSSKKINILIGKNNTGKTTILEAINHTINTDTIVSDLLQEYDPYLNKIINTNKEESEIIITTKNKEKKLIIKLPETEETVINFKKDLLNRVSKIIPDKKNWNSREEELIDKLLTNEKFLSDIKKESIKVITSEKENIIFSYSSNILNKLSPILDELTEKSKISADLSLIGGFKGLLKNRFFQLFSIKLNKKDNNIIFIKNLLAQDKHGIDKSAVNKVDNHLKKKKMLKNLERFDLDTILFKKNNKEWEIPFSFMGDGFKAIINLIINLNEKNKIVLIEELENHLHPEYIQEVIKYIINFSKINNTQFFITTHSSDILKTITLDDLSKEHNDYLSKELNIIKLECLENEILHKELNKDQAKDEIKELLLDLRGI